MAQKEGKRPQGRPANPVDQRLFENACKLHCTDAEIKFLFNIGSDHLTKFCKETYGKPFREVADQFRSVGKMSVRRNLLKLSEHNASACIFLAKNWLGMKEYFEIDTPTPAQPLQIEVTGVDNPDRVKMIEASITKPNENSKTL